MVNGGWCLWMGFYCFFCRWHHHRLACVCLSTCPLAAGTEQRMTRSQWSSLLLTLSLPLTSLPLFSPLSLLQARWWGWVMSSPSRCLRGGVWPITTWHGRPRWWASDSSSSWVLLPRASCLLSHCLTSNDWLVSVYQSLPHMHIGLLSLTHKGEEVFREGSCAVTNTPSASC